MNSINVKISDALARTGLKPRPNSSVAFVVSFLLPLSVLIAQFKTPEILTNNYKLAIIAAFGILLSNSILIYKCIKFKDFKLQTFHYLSTIFISFLFYVCLHRGILFSIYSGTFSTILYYKTVPLLFKTFPECFSFGEATLTIQGVLLFFYSASVNIFQSALNTPSKVSQISTLILQVGTTALGLILLITYKTKFFQRTIPFYALVLFIVGFFVLIPLHIILKESAILWVIKRLTNSNRTIHVILFWCVCCFFAAIALHNQIRKGRKANTITRKTFHILIFIVYLIGLIDQCSVLYLASGVIFIVFVLLETFRVLNLPPLGRYLEDGFVVMKDEKDSGNIALTPICLLVGCSLPLWIHPDTCDVTDSAGFNLLPLISGILTIGIGDTFASAIGTWFGKYKWPRSKKTFEGTLACIFSQLALIFTLFNSGYVIYNQINITKSVIAIIVSSIVEAKTDQIDNLILPLTCYLILY